MSQKLVVLVGSPRRNGNCAALADAVRRGAQSQGTEVAVRFLDDYISAFLRDCRTCRQPDGSCSIEDRYRSLFLDDFLGCAAAVICSPIYWYGMSAQTKAFFDRSFCYYAASYPDSGNVAKAMAHKRLGLVLSSEETYPGAELGIVQQFQEFARYTHSALVGIVRGIGNKRGEVSHDPSDPTAQAERLGAEILTRPYSDYRLDTVRSMRVWPEN